MSPERPSTPTLAAAAHRSGASFELVLGPVLMALIGLFIDRRLGTAPWFTVGFAVWGLLGAGVLVYYRYRRQMESLRTPAVGGGIPEGPAPGGRR